MKVKYSRSRHNAKQTSFTSPTGARRQCGEQEHAQYCTNHDVTSGWSCRRPENVSSLSSLLTEEGFDHVRCFTRLKQWSRMLVFLIEIVGAEGVGGGSEARIGERKFSMDGRREKLEGGGGVTQKCIMIAMEKGFKEQTQDNERGEPDMQDTGGWRFPLLFPSPPPKSPACLKF